MSQGSQVIIMKLNGIEERFHVHECDNRVAIRAVCPDVGALWQILDAHVPEVQTAHRPIRVWTR